MGVRPTPRPADTLPKKKATQDSKSTHVVPYKKPKVVEHDLEEFRPQKETTAIVKKKKLKLSKTNLESLESILGDRTQDILQLLETNETDGAITLLYRRLLMMTVDLIPLAENAVRKTKGFKGVYQVNGLVSQCRELLADIQATQDRGAMGRNLVTRLIQPAFLDIAMQIVQSGSRLEASLKSLTPPSQHERIRSTFERHQRELAHYIQEQYKNIASEMVRGLT
jgi:hypothetical protein